MYESIYLLFLHIKIISAIFIYNLFFLLPSLKHLLILNCKRGDISSLYSLITFLLMSPYPVEVILIFLITSEISCCEAGFREKLKKGTGSGTNYSKVAVIAGC